MNKGVYCRGGTYYPPQYKELEELYIEKVRVIGVGSMVILPEELAKHCLEQKLIDDNL